MRILHNVGTAIAFAVLALACASQRSLDDDHAHEETLQFTVYNSDLELFAETAPFVVGQASDIKAHFSATSDFKPLSGAKVTASLIVGEQGIRQTTDVPSKSGIYDFALTPVVMGAGRLVFDIETENGSSRVVVENIVVYDDEHTAHEAAALAAVTGSNTVTFTKEQSWKIDFATGIIEPSPFGQVIRTTARVMPAQGDESVVVARASGIVDFTGGDIVAGRAVKAGESLFSINSSRMADDNLSVRYGEAAAEYNRAKSDYDRKRELAKDRIISERELADAQAAFEASQAVYDNLRRNFSTGSQSVGSPMGGFVKQVLVRNGEFVEAGQSVVVVSQNRDLLITANLQPRHYGVLGDIESANFRVAGTGQTYSLDDLSGSLLSYGRAVDEQNPLIPVTFRVRNSVNLLPGSFVEAFIKTKALDDALTVPNKAIVEEMGSYFVFVQLTGELFEKRAIDKGATDGLNTRIARGIESGERIVTRGAVSVRLAQAAGAVDPHSGHAH